MAEKLDKIRNFLLDMDGTLYLGGRLFEATPAFLAAIHDSGRKLLFLTNNSSRSTFEYHQKLNDMGLAACEDEIFTSTRATMIYLKNHTVYRKLYLLAVPTVEEEFRQNGFDVTDESPDAVVLCFDRTLTYDKLRKACELIMRGTPYIATHPDLVCPTENLPIPDAGSIIELIRAATGGAIPKIIGKPNSEMIDSAMEKLAATPADTAIVGDRIYTDMEMGFRAGLTTVLVLSGEAKREHLDSLARQPDYVVESVGDLTEILRSCAGFRKKLYKSDDGE
ncbi:MAG TPA: HAD-IIA family hydrolase [Phycisphaerae bacterium]|nr:HAD-IIA family hydrolase [Phycisphaerae bacterium]HPS52843.1 HAD-IIA family hydrolase [Phycisphaerae bacterium]